MITEYIVEGLVEEDFKNLKDILENHTSFKPTQKQELITTLSLVKKINSIINALK